MPAVCLQGPGSNITLQKGLDPTCNGLNTLFSFNRNGSITTGIDGQCVQVFGRPGSPRYHYDVQTYHCDASHLQDSDKWVWTSSGEIQQLRGGKCLSSGPPKPGGGGGGGGDGTLTWLGPLADGEYVLLLVNDRTDTASLSFNSSNIPAEAKLDQFQGWS